MSFHVLCQHSTWRAPQAFEPWHSKLCLQVKHQRCSSLAYISLWTIPRFKFFCVKPTTADKKKSQFQKVTTSYCNFYMISTRHPTIPWTLPGLDTGLSYTSEAAVVYFHRTGIMKSSHREMWQWLAPALPPSHPLCIHFSLTHITESALLTSSTA